jgi:hypothetical protein
LLSRRPAAGLNIGEIDHRTHGELADEKPQPQDLLMLVWTAACAMAGRTVNAPSQLRTEP